MPARRSLHHLNCAQIRDRRQRRLGVHVLPIGAGYAGDRVNVLCADLYADRVRTIRRRMREQGAEEVPPADQAKRSPAANASSEPTRTALFGTLLAGELWLDRDGLGCGGHRVASIVWPSPNAALSVGSGGSPRRGCVSRSILLSRLARARTVM